MAASPKFTYDPATDVGKIRLRINDTDLTKPGATSETYANREDWTVFFSDQEISSMLGQASSSLNLATALCLRAIASSKTLLAKWQKYKLDDVEVDLGRLADAILKQAESLEELEEEQEGPFVSIGGPDNSLFDLAERRWIEDLK